jgi:hypothetical protein
MLVEDYIFADRGRFEGEFYVGEARLMKEVDMTKCLFGGNTTFDATEFESGLDLDSSEFMDALEFHKIELQGWADLERMSCNGPVVIERTNFHRGVDFQDSVFSEPLSIQDVHIGGEAYFRWMRNAQRFNMINTRFEDCVDLRDLNIDYDVYFENVEFRRAVYISKSQFKANLRWDSVIVGDLVNAREMVASGSVHWIDCHLREDLILTGATLASEFDLTGSIVTGSLDLRRATFSGPAEFISCQLDSTIRLEGINAGDFRISVDQVQHNLESEQTKEWAMAVREWEFLYQSLESRNQTREADIAFFKMRQMKNRASITGIVGRLRALFERIFSEWGTGYGTRPINVFVFAVLSVFIFAALYRFVPGVSSVVSESGGPDQSVDFGDYLYFSLTTFTALAATFFSFGRLLVSTEAFVGGFLVALFTATLTRKIFRQ